MSLALVSLTTGRIQAERSYGEEEIRIRYAEVRIENGGKRAMLRKVRGKMLAVEID